MTVRRFIFICCLALAIPKSTFPINRDTLVVADALQSNMVLQQNKAFNVWGRAHPGDQVAIKADWMTDPIKVTANVNGEFLGLITVPSARKGDFTPHQIQVSTLKEKQILTNLLIGDLWFCSGQSNMQFSVKEMIDAKEEIEGANQSNIRLLSVGLNFSTEPVNNFTGKWKICSAETVKDFSAVGYTFGRKLFDELNIPIGIIFSGIGASAVQPYVPQEQLASDELLNETYLKPYLESTKATEKIDGGFSFEKVTRPFLLYNAMIHPFINLSIKGFCWYQGESNHMERSPYVRATQVMIKSWRQRFQQGDDPKLAYDAFFREAQEQISTLNNTAMVSTMDVGAAKDLHPKNKKPIGLRLAAVALNRTYNNLSVNYQGPKYSYLELKKNVVTIHFVSETLGSGLNTNDGAPPKFFYIAGDNQIFYPAEAKIVDDTIVLDCKNVKHPKSVRYAFFNFPVTNLQNKEGFPVNPFRTDQWPESK